MRLEYTNTKLQEAAIRSFRDSLGKAKERLAVSQQDVDQKEQELRKAKAVRDAAEEDCNLYLNLLSGNFSIADQKLSIPPTDTKDAELDEEEDDGDMPDASDQDGIIRKRRRRLNAQPKTLEIVKSSAHFLTVDQAVNLVKAAYPEGVISEKTIKNAVWNLTSAELLVKFYDKPLREYIYGLPEWFDGNKPKSEFIKSEQTVDEVESIEDEEIIEDEEEEIIEDEEDEMVVYPFDPNERDDLPF